VSLKALCHTNVHVIHMNESCLTYETWMGHVVSLKALCHTNVHVIHMNESCLTHEKWMSHVVSLKALCRTLCYMTRSYVWRNAFKMTYVVRLNALCHTYERVVRHAWQLVIDESYHGWVMSHIRLRHVCDEWMSVIFKNDICDVWIMCVTWLIHVCDMTHLYVSHDSFMSHLWLRHICDVWMSRVTSMIASRHKCERVMWMSHGNESCHAHGSWW